MSSINTNLSAITALQSLKTTQNAMNKTQGQISTGLRVGEASHNASYWSISTKMKSDNGALGAVKDSIKQSKAMIDTFSSAMDKSLTYLNKMKEKLTAGANPGADLAAIQVEIKGSIEGLKSAAQSATINGQNWLNGAAKSVDLVTSFDGSTGKVQFLQIDTGEIQLFEDANGGAGGILGGVAAINVATRPAASYVDIEFDAATFAPADTDTIDVEINGMTASLALTGNEKSLNDLVNAIRGDDTMNALVSASVVDGQLRLESKIKDQDIATITAGVTGLTAGTPEAHDPAVTQSTEAALDAVNAAISAITAGSSMLGANKALLETQEEFIGVLSDSLTAGVSAYVDADMNEASTRYQALQTRQQLGVQALSMANQNSQMILKLFQ